MLLLITLGIEPLVSLFRIEARDEVQEGASRRRRRRQAYLYVAEVYAELHPQDFSNGFYDFIVGDNRTTAGKYRNRPLNPDTRYYLS